MVSHKLADNSIQKTVGYLAIYELVVIQISVWDIILDCSDG